MPNQLTKYSGPWNNRTAKHLLIRASYACTKENIAQVQSMGMEAAVDMLLSDRPLPDPPVNYYFEDDANVAIGDTWHDKPYVDGGIKKFPRRISLQAWLVKQMLEEGIHIREKMVLFWMNHFAIQISASNDPRFHYIYNSLLRTNALGNFKALIDEITVDPTMLRYLNGNLNQKNRPNENFARELMELYTLGKGELAGPGDYTTFTEKDVIEVARALTGWRDRGFSAISFPGDIYAEYRSSVHDQTDKTLSHRFDNAVIANNEDLEYKDVIDLIFQKDQTVAQFIVRKLYRWFAYYEIDQRIEDEVIVPLAQCFIDSNWEIKPVLKALFESAVFYSEEVNGAIIKSPVEFVMNLMNQSGLVVPKDDLFVEYSAYRKFYDNCSLAQQDILEPPNVGGWKAYYQEPAFLRSWINSVTLPIRKTFGSRMLDFGYTFGGIRVDIDVLAFIANLDNPLEPNELILEISNLFYPEGLTEKQRNYLKTILIPGLPDFEWTVEYTDFLDHPDDSNLQRSIESKVMALLNAMISLPEYQLI